VNILNWPDWEIIGVTEQGNEFRVAAAYKLQPTACTRCGAVFGLENGPRKFGSFQQVIRDKPIQASPCAIDIKRQRYQCRECNQTFAQPLPDVDEKRMMTKRLHIWMQQESIKRTFADVARMTGVTEATVRNVFKEWVDHLDATVRFETPRVLGLDEMHLLHDMRCILTNVEQRTVVGLLPSRTKDIVYRHLLMMPERYKVELVTMDMWNPYRDAVRAVWPNMTIVVDKFHITRMANAALESIRKDLRKSLTDKLRRGMMHDRFVLLKRRTALRESEILKLDTWTHKFPTLALAYELKEGFFDIWEAQDGATARRMYADWKERITTELAPTFRELTTAMTNWDAEVFAYFEGGARGRVTNAYTEAVNGIAKIANRNRRGYSFDAIRAKVLYTKGTHVQSVKGGISNLRAREAIERDYLRPVEEQANRSIGIEISTIKQLLTNEDFYPVSTEDFG
jgi:transposase